MGGWAGMPERTSGDRDSSGEHARSALDRIVSEKIRKAADEHTQKEDALVLVREAQYMKKLAALINPSSRLNHVQLGFVEFLIRRECLHEPFPVVRLDLVFFIDSRT